MFVDFNINQPTISSFLDVQKQVYTRHEGKTGNIWYVSTGSNPAHHILCSSSNKDGFGGSTLSIRLQNGITEKVKGLWNSNADDLYQDTGIDVRETYLIKFIISRQCEILDFNTRRYSEILENETVGKTGNFHMAKQHAKAWKNLLDVKIYYGEISHGGGSHNWID